jgi:hypothetical protein
MRAVHTSTASTVTNSFGDKRVAPLNGTAFVVGEALSVGLTVPLVGAEVTGVLVGALVGSFVGASVLVVGALDFEGATVVGFVVGDLDFEGALVRGAFVLEVGALVFSHLISFPIHLLFSPHSR